MARVLSGSNFVAMKKHRNNSEKFCSPNCAFLLFFLGCLTIESGSRREKSSAPLAGRRVMPTSLFATKRGASGSVDPKFDLVRVHLLPLACRAVARGHGPPSPHGLRRGGLRRFASEGWWARQDSNLQPDRYERPALTIELQAPPGTAVRSTARQRCGHLLQGGRRSGNAGGAGKISGTLGRPQALDVQSTDTPAKATTLRHFSVWSAMNRP
jgi:hypothetical protein